MSEDNFVAGARGRSRRTEQTCRGAQRAGAEQLEGARGWSLFVGARALLAAMAGVVVVPGG